MLRLHRWKFRDDPWFATRPNADALQFVKAGVSEVVTLQTCRKRRKSEEKSNSKAAGFIKDGLTFPTLPRVFCVCPPANPQHLHITGRRFLAATCILSTIKPSPAYRGYESQTKFWWKLNIKRWCSEGEKTAEKSITWCLLAAVWVFDEVIDFVFNIILRTTSLSAFLLRLTWGNLYLPHGCTLNMGWKLRDSVSLC